jgi:hypothetical protein
VNRSHEQCCLLQPDMNFTGSLHVLDRGQQFESLRSMSWTLLFVRAIAVPHQLETDWQFEPPKSRQTSCVSGSAVLMSDQNLTPTAAFEPTEIWPSA